jgi:hypothetical protein
MRAMSAGELVACLQKEMEKALGTGWDTAKIA